MEHQNETEEKELVNLIYDYAAELLLEKEKSPSAVRLALEEKGLSKESAAIVVSKIMDQIKEAKRQQANKDMLFGALWCAGGIIATVANFGYIFWGAIVFGAIQFIKGASKS